MAAGAQSLLAQQIPPRAASAQIQDAAGNTVGTVLLTEQNNKVLVVARLNGLPAGFHGFHIHTTGSCESSAEGMFMAAGGHLNPNGAEHPNHAGDLPALLVNNDGTAFLSFETDRLTMADILDADGSAIMIHSDADNYANIPPRYAATAGIITATPIGTPAASGIGGAGTNAADEESKRAGDSGSPLACGVLIETVIEPPAASATATGSGTSAPAEVTSTVTETPADMTATPAEFTQTPEGTPPGTLPATPNESVTPATLTTPTLESILPTPSSTPTP
ncbi:MAG: superoxide dismutase family protein [Anaerolineae bacterium]|nr:superoxide dismutase family protein [Anaerolineae bacterium]